MTEELVWLQVGGGQGQVFEELPCVKGIYLIMSSSKDQVEVEWK